VQEIVLRFEWRGRHRARTEFAGQSALSATIGVYRAQNTIFPVAAMEDRELRGNRESQIDLLDAHRASAACSTIRSSGIRYFLRFDRKR